MCTFILDCPECFEISYRMTRQRKQNVYGCKNQHGFLCCKYCKELFPYKKFFSKIRIKHYLHFFL
jgi:hypothetical protein